MVGFSLDNFERIIGKSVTVLTRKNLEDEDGEQILRKAEEAKVAFLVPGDPLVATTHIDLRIRAERRGIRTRIVHGTSIISAVIGLSGLQNYRFGRSVTVPFLDSISRSETPYNVIQENRMRNLHTLCFLDIRAGEKRFMTIREALESLLILEEKKKCNVITLNSLVLGVARAGAKDAVVKAEQVRNLIVFDFGNPPHVLVFPAPTFHFMEAEALIRLAKAPESVRKMVM